MSTDLTQGNPLKLLTLFSLPILAGNIFQQFYSMVDAVIVGRYVGEKALAAVGCTGSINFFILGAAIGLTVGFSIIISQLYGARDEAALRRAVAVSIELSAIFSVIIALFSVAGASPLLKLMQTPIDIFQGAYSYIVIVFLGIPGLVYYNLFSGILRSVGDSRTPLLFLILASVGNVILDLVFIIVFKMGPAGAAAATVVSQTLSGIACLFYIARKFPFLIPHKQDWRFSPELAHSLIRLGIPSALSNSVCALGCMAIQGAVNGFGSEVVAGYTAGTKIEALANQPCFAFSTALGTYVGQNVGARRMDRVRQGMHDCLKLMAIAGVFGALISFLFARPLVEVFLPTPSEKVVASATQYLSIIGPFIFILGVLCAYRSAVAGMGNANIPMISGAVELAVRLPIAFIVSRLWGYGGVCISAPAAWFGGTLLVFFAYYRIERSLAARLGVSS